MPPRTTTHQVRLERVIDGDTVVITMGKGFLRGNQEARIRLYGIDAPESSQKGGDEATRHLKKMIGSRRKIWLDVMDNDQYGRIVGMIYHRRGHPEDSYNLRMVEAGHARCYMTRPIHRSRYLQAEESARAKRRGIWKQRNRVDPWDYRKQQAAKKKEGGLGKLLLLAILAALAAAIFIYLYLRYLN